MVRAISVYWALHESDILQGLLHGLSDLIVGLTLCHFAYEKIESQSKKLNFKMIHHVK
jgi:hypothetical protein